MVFAKIIEFTPFYVFSSTWKSDKMEIEKRVISLVGESYSVCPLDNSPIMRVLAIQRLVFDCRKKNSIIFDKGLVNIPGFCTNTHGTVKNTPCCCNLLP